MRPLSITVASVLFVVIGLGFGLSAFPVARYLARHHELPIVFGIRAFAGPFERFGPGVFGRLLTAYGVLSLLEVLAGVWLWRGLKQGALLGVVLSAVNAVFWVGFALPIPLIGGPLRILLLMLGWRSLR